MKKMLSLTGLVLVLAACSSITTDPNWRPDMTNANFGKYPTNYPEIIKTWGDDHFDNPKAVSYVSMSSPREEYIVTDSEKQQANFGYSVCANIGGVKSDSYYKPFKKYWFFIRNGKVVEQRDLEYGYNKVIYRDHKINCDDAN
ncbi:hypothetical protein DES39_0484 [Orbus hercynius]|uniref:Type IV secretion system putative lipoprotein virB7 n=1 Tax=Orbus hercynius TaxID=593135 RepID=A0A495RJ07_9GAMM|nr:membrane lipoprotein lipid attachment site-containing protein [Orbus hercynius]RKS87264.1 hypothetical protein DES39_0484 [Orbus hercynius]